MKPPYPSYCASAPHHVTSIWKPYYTNDVYLTGSKGIGVLLDPPTRVCKYKAPPIIGKDAGSIELVVNLAKRFEEKHGCYIPLTDFYVFNPLPPGKGYAVSASTLIAASMVFSYECKIPFEEGFEHAHAIEVQHKSGLGDVLAITKGYSIVLRTKPGSPRNGETISIPVPMGTSVVAIEREGQHTTELLASYDKDASILATRFLEVLQKHPNYQNFLRYSHEFSLAAGLHRFNDLIQKVKSWEGVVGVYAKKAVMMIFTQNIHLRRIVRLLAEMGFEPRVLEISYKPPTLFSYR
ncbi:MAG: hypothetical protein F7C32_01560 [Desulfurococcales archaeon]|nr:hypothetical protein [Desulfurococcales archaeon]